MGVMSDAHTHTFPGSFKMRQIKATIRENQQRMFSKAGYRLIAMNLGLEKIWAVMSIFSRG